jgi:hypothetical protein
MRTRLAVAVLAVPLLVGNTAAAQAPAGFASLGDGLDDLCRTGTSPRTIALCSDRQLRVFDEVRARLNPDQQKALLADQNGWVKSYAIVCGLAQDEPPALPLSAAIKECMAKAGQARIAYLTAYGGKPLSTVATPTAPAPTESMRRMAERPLWIEGIYRDKPAPPSETREDDEARTWQSCVAGEWSGDIHDLEDMSPRCIAQALTQPCRAYQAWAWSLFTSATTLPPSSKHLSRWSGLTDYKQSFIDGLVGLNEVAYHNRGWAKDANEFARTAYDACMVGHLLQPLAGSAPQANRPPKQPAGSPAKPSEATTVRHPGEQSIEEWVQEGIEIEKQTDIPPLTPPNNIPSQNITPREASSKGLIHCNVGLPGRGSAYVSIWLKRVDCDEWLKSAAAYTSKYGKALNNFRIRRDEGQERAAEAKRQQQAAFGNRLIYALFLCPPVSGAACQMTGEARMTPAGMMPAVTFDSLADCKRYAQRLSGLVLAPSDGRFQVSNGAWYECRWRQSAVWK